MGQNIDKMVIELNKLITNELLMSGGIYLPKVGSLSVETMERSPKRTVNYREGEIDGLISLVSVIALKTKCSVEQATKLYDKWYEAVQKMRQVEIEGIGTIRAGRFEVSEVILGKLNPANVVSTSQTETQTKPITPKQTPQTELPKRERKGGAKYIAVLIVVAIGVGVSMYIKGGDDTPTKNIEPQSVPMVELTPATPIIEEVSETEAAKSETKIIEIEEAVEPQTEPQTEPDQHLKSERGELMSYKARTASNSQAIEIFEKTLTESQERPETKYKVVYGVYSSKANAGRAIIDAIEKNRDTVSSTYGVTLRNGKYMVTLFESDHFYTSVSFMKRNDEYFENALWVYDPQKM